MIIRKKRLTKLLKNGYEAGIKEEKGAPGFHSCSTSYSSFKTNTFSDGEDEPSNKGLKALGVGTGLGILTKLGLDHIDPPEEITDEEKNLRKALKERESREISWSPIQTFKDMWDENKQKTKDLKELDKKVEAAKAKFTENLKSRNSNKYIAGIVGSVGAIGTLALLNTKKHNKHKHVTDKMHYNDDEMTRVIRESSKNYEQGDYKPNFHESRYEKRERKPLFNRFRGEESREDSQQHSESKEKRNTDEEYVLPVDKEQVRETVEHALQNPEETAEKLRKIKTVASDVALAKNGYELFGNLRHNLFDID